VQLTGHQRALIASPIAIGGVMLAATLSLLWTRNGL
jgi:hypothetical protein